jgi:hypothetical protein
MKMKKPKKKLYAWAVVDREFPAIYDTCRTRKDARHKLWEKSLPHWYKVIKLVESK